MGNEVNMHDVGDSIPFVFDRAGQSLDGWVCTIFVKTFPGDVTLVDRIITAAGTVWEGFLTSTETLAMGVGDFRLIAKMVKAATDKRETASQVNRFRLSEAYAD